MRERVLLWLLVMGCASNSGVIPIGRDTYLVSRQAATGLFGPGTLKVDALREANEFCQSKGKLLQVVRTEEAKPPYVFTNVPKAEVQFMCLDEGDPDLARPKLNQGPDTGVEKKDGAP